MSTLTDDEQEAIWDGWSEIYRAQDEVLIENGEAWRCQECGALNKDDESLCKECGYAPDAWLCSCGTYIEKACHCSNCGGQAPWGCDCGLRDDIELRDEDDAFVYDPEEYGTSDHYYRGLDKPSGNDEWWLDSQEDDDET